MNPRMRSFAWVLVVLAVAVLAWVALRPRGTDVPTRPAGSLDKASVLGVFQSEDPERVRVALAALRGVKPAPIDWLLGNLVHPNRGVREWSAHALGDVAPPDERVVQAFMQMLEDEDDLVRWKAVRGLGRIGPPASAALTLLRPIAETDQEHEVVRAAAQRAVQQIGGP